ncbi:MAG TPA: hypothetical protein P5032_10180 [Candidatus Competibacter sp.]|nr:hypothetical protein [Candidatus Competibacter sp.]
MHDDFIAEAERDPIRLDLDHDLLLDPHTRRIRFTRTGQKALAARFARSGVDWARLRTLDDVETAIAQVTHHEYQRLPAGEQDDAERVDALHDLDFIVEGVKGLPLAPLKARRERRAQAFEHRLAELGLTPTPLFDAPRGEGEPPRG